MNKHADIETVVIDIERAQAVSEDADLDRHVREDALVQFVKRSAAPLISLLDELKNLREQMESGSGGDLGGKTHRVIVEGFSDKSAEAAFSEALDKAAHYFSEDRDIAITVQQLVELADGGHRATLEVHITPVTQHHHAHLKSADVELKRDHDKAFHDMKAKEDDALHHLIFDHFSAINTAEFVANAPPSLLINVNDAKILHYMLEKQFLKAERAWDNVKDSAPKPHKILVRFKRDRDIAE